MTGSDRRRIHIDDYVDSLVTKPLLDDKFDIRKCQIDVLLNRKADFDEPISYTFEKSGQSSRYKDALSSFLQACFEHVRANPSNPGNIAALCSLYAFPRDTEYESWTGRVLRAGSSARSNTSERKVDQLARDSELPSPIHAAPWRGEN